MARWTAPADTSGVTLSIGPLVVVDGIVDVPDDLSEGDRSGLTVNGFVPAPAEVPRDAKAKAPVEPLSPVEPAAPAEE